jgi:hypothetical protein
MTEPAPALATDTLVGGQRNELEIGVTLQSRFLGVAQNEFREPIVFLNDGYVRVAQTSSDEGLIKLLRAAERIPGYAGAYQLVNGPVCADLSARMAQDKWVITKTRATDRDVAMRRAIYVDVDALRPKGISSTDSELSAAWEVANEIRQYLAERIGGAPIGFGCSGNGYFLLVALLPVAERPEFKERISKLLKLLGRKFSTDRVGIDSTVCNVARLMPAAGTMKCKGRSTAERPHRRTSFSCALRPSTGEPDRVPIEALI